MNKVAIKVHDDISDCLRDKNYKGSQKTGGYKYPHDDGGWVEQEYLPYLLKNHRFYFPTENGREAGIVIPKLKQED